MSDELHPGEIPDWLLQMRPQEEGFGDEPTPAPQEEIVDDFLDDLAGEPEPEASSPVLEEPIEQQVPARDDFLGGLREQMSQDEDLYDDRQAQRSSLARAFATMLPWQRFVLALLLFFNVAVLGCMLLAMAGRIVPSF